MELVEKMTIMISSLIISNKMDINYKKLNSRIDIVQDYIDKKFGRVIDILIYNKNDKVKEKYYSMENLINA